MWSDRMHGLLQSPITALLVAFVFAAIAFSGRFSLNLSNILLFFALVLGCFGIVRSGLGLHFTIIFCLLLASGLTFISWWIQPIQPKKPTADIATGQPKLLTAEEIAKEPKKLYPQGLIPQTEKEEKPTFTEKIEKVTVQLGMSATVPIERLKGEGWSGSFNFGGYRPIRVYLEGNKLFADVFLYGGTEQPPLEIKHNQFVLRNTEWDRNFDSVALEVVNESRVPVFQLIYKTRNKIVINGLFSTPSGVVFATDRDGMKIINDPVEINNALKKFTLQRLFKYPSLRFEGQRDEGDTSKSEQQKKPVVQSPSMGNLKQRAIALSEAVVVDLYRHGDSPTFPRQKAIQKKVADEFPIKPMPTTHQEQINWIVTRSLYFKQRYFEKVVNMRDEFAEIHIRNEQLDDFLKFRAMTENGHKGSKEPVDVTFPISPLDIEQISEWLQMMAEQIKD